MHPPGSAAHSAVHSPVDDVVDGGAAGRRWTVLGLLVVLVGASPILHTWLVDRPQDQWQVDLEVYREAARGIVIGRPVYDFLTENPQFLPFTYPPFSAVLGLPLLLLPFPVLGWVWSLAQLVVLYVTTGIAFRPFLARWARRRPLVQGVVAAALAYCQPVSDGIRFGQVNWILLLLCLADLTAGRPRWPRGMLIGLAVAIKLTPGVFLVHLAITRRWSELRVAVATAVAVTVAALLVVPQASLDFWTRALLSSDRLGPNMGTSNQSVRGLILRQEWPDRVTSLVWLLAVVPVAIVGFRLASRLHERGEQVAVVGALGSLAVLLSPVSWVHHLHWEVATLGALLGAATTRRRILVTLGGWLLLVAPLPWWGIAVLDGDLAPHWAGRILQNGFLIYAVGALVALRWVVGRADPGGPQGVPPFGRRGRPEHGTMAPLEH